MENPVKTIVIIATGRNPADHQVSASVGDVNVLRIIVVLPENVTIFLIQTDSAGLIIGIAGIVVKSSIKERGMFRAFLARAQSVGGAPQVVFAQVKSIAIKPLRRRVTIGHERF